MSAGCERLLSVSSQTCIYFYQNEMDLMLLEVLVGVQKEKNCLKFFLLLKVAGSECASRRSIWPASNDNPVDSGVYDTYKDSSRSVGFSIHSSFLSGMFPINVSRSNITRRLAAKYDHFISGRPIFINKVSL
jgi:hypothetical protein